MNETVTGTHVQLEEILCARERRRENQMRLLGTYESTLISFTLNIVGEIKVFPLTILTFEEGLRLIRRRCESESLTILSQRVTREHTGYEALMAVDGNAEQVKTHMCELEEGNPLGRIFDIDVIASTGRQISRTDVGFPERRCLLCSGPAASCARSRAHNVEQLLEEECRIMRTCCIDLHASTVGDLAVKALLYEVAVTPKPGLVDKNNSGAHTDMNIFTFIDSALSLRSYFEELARIGTVDVALSPAEVFDRIRPVGRKAEADMFRATGGVNTHKGLIFSLGIICCAAGRMLFSAKGYSRDALSLLCADMTIHLLEDFSDAGPETAGKTCFTVYGVQGIRGEASKGFPTLFSIALEELSSALSSGCSLNNASVRTLVRIMSTSDDTNIISRSSYKRMCEIRKEMEELTSSEEWENSRFLKRIEQLDREFIDENISPGGSADLLALALFIHFYETEINHFHCSVLSVLPE